MGRKDASNCLNSYYQQHTQRNPAFWSGMQVPVPLRANGLPNSKPRLSCLVGTTLVGRVAVSGIVLRNAAELAAPGQTLAHTWPSMQRGGNRVHLGLRNVSGERLEPCAIGLTDSNRQVAGLASMQFFDCACLPLVCASSHCAPIAVLDVGLFVCHKPSAWISSIQHSRYAHLPNA